MNISFFLCYCHIVCFVKSPSVFVLLAARRYTIQPPQLWEAVSRWLATQHKWNVAPEEMVFTPNLVLATVNWQVSLWIVWCHYLRTLKARTHQHYSTVRCQFKRFCAFSAAPI
jgi:hypothetical protein